MPRVVRRQTPYQRISSYLNPLDHLLRLATDYEAFDWDNWQNTWGTPLGLLLNVICMISRGHADNYRREANPVFGERSSRRSTSNGLSYLLWVAQTALAIFSVCNAIYCFTRKKRYRLFESNIEVEPKTPSARRVPVDSSPIANSPLRVLGNIIEPFRNDAASRAHPDETRDVWEVGVWDPSPLSLHILAFLSPVHVAIYFLALPITSHPLGRSTGYETGTSSAAVYFTVILTQILLSLQIIFLKSWFIQQAWDQKVISKEVMHEYDAKYVHPRLNVIKRDVAVQCSLSTNTDSRGPEVQVYTPQFNRSGFKTYANPNYFDLTVQTPAPPPFSRSSTNTGTTPGIFSRGATPMQPITGRTRQPQLARTTANTPRHAADDDKDHESHTRRRETTAHAGYDQPARRMGTDGLVEWSRQNSRGLSPSKMSTPLKKGSSIRGSTYAESLGAPLGTPVRRRQF